MSTLRSMRFVTLLGGLAALCLLIAAPGQATHPRPAGASPLRVSFVPAYSQCVAPNRTHGPPLAFPSCNPPVQTSAQATVGTPDANGGATSFSSTVVFRPAISSSPGPPEEGDLFISIQMNDVRCVPTGVRCGTANASGPADYSGEVRFVFTTRITDHYNAVAPGGGPDAATVVDTSIEVDWQCAETASTSTGSTCNLNTAVNSFIPGAIKETKRTIWETSEVRVYDGGPDGDADTTADNTVFLRQGIFIP
jgi:hypothetical protein